MVATRRPRPRVVIEERKATRRHLLSSHVRVGGEPTPYSCPICLCLMPASSDHCPNWARARCCGQVWHFLLLQVRFCWRVVPLFLGKEPLDNLGRIKLVECVDRVRRLAIGTAPSVVDRGGHHITMQAASLHASPTYISIIIRRLRRPVRPPYLLGTCNAGRRNTPMALARGGRHRV